MRWSCNASLKPCREEWDWTATGRQFYKREKRGTKELSCAISLDFRSVYQGVIYWKSTCHRSGENRRAERAQEVRLEERPLNWLLCDNRLCTSASLWQMPIMSRALNCIESRRGRCDAGMPAHRGEQHSIELLAMLSPQETSWLIMGLEVEETEPFPLADSGNW